MTILNIDSSINGDNSASRAISRSIVDQLRAFDPGAAMVTRDLVSAPLPHLTLDAFADSSVLDEFLAADTIGASLLGKFRVLALGENEHPLAFANDSISCKSYFWESSIPITSPSSNMKRLPAISTCCLELLAR